MTKPDNDTDPSTPGAKRVSDPEDVSLDGAHPAPAAVLSRATTDPGVAPPPEQMPASQRPMGIVVPPVATNLHDSVEILLEGIHRSEPERRRPMSQTAGQAMASYHAEHMVRAAQQSPGDEPKVVIEQRIVAQTLRIARAKAAGRKARIETVPPKRAPLAGRVLIAVALGLGVVFVIFVALRRTSGEMTGTTRASAAVSAPISTAAPPVTGAENALAPPMPKDVAGAAITPAEEGLSPTASASVSNNTTRKSPPAWRPSRQRPRPSPSAPRPAATDLGEFRTSF